MFVGHYSASFAARALEPKLPLWLLFLAVQLVDVAWGVFVLTGIEHFRVEPGFTKAVPFDLYHMPYTHSLLASFCWAAAAFVICLQIPQLRSSIKACLLIALAVLSHWFLDLPVHAPDLPIVDESTKLGFGLWNLPFVALALELGLLFAAIYWCLKRNPDMNRRRVWGFAGLMTIMQTVFYFGPVVVAETGAALSALSSFIILILVAAWVEQPSRTAN